MNPILAILSLIIGGIAGFILAHYILMPLYRYIVRSSDKRKIKTKMLMEKYYNDIYEEALTEDIDKATKRAHRKMSKLKTG